MGRGKLRAAGRMRSNFAGYAVQGNALKVSKRLPPQLAMAAMVPVCVRPNDASLPDGITVTQLRPWFLEW